MISLKRYLDSASTGATMECEPGEEQALCAEIAAEEELLPATIAAYRSALREMGRCSLDACPALGGELRQSLGRLEESLAIDAGPKAVAVAERSVRERLQDWGRRIAQHYRQKTSEVKELLIVMARTAESVGERDQRCAQQIHEVTNRLRGIANLEDLTLIRASIEKSASDLRTSIDRMTAEGKAAIQQLQAQVSNYQTKLEAAEEIASCDSLTGLRSRLCVETHIERRIEAALPFCLAIVDIDGFKRVNDDHGHLAGDELLRKFADKLKSVCRSTDLIGRWGGDEFIILLHCGIPEARAQIDRLSEWVCANYMVQGKPGRKRLRVNASIGLAEYMPGETMKELLARADAAMYEQKAASRAVGNSAQR